MSQPTPELKTPHDPIGRTLARYHVTAAIGAGGMGQVFRATDTRLGRAVAVKDIVTVSARRFSR